MENDKKNVCVQCGALMKENAKFCSKCGKAVSEREERLNAFKCEAKLEGDNIVRQEDDKEMENDALKNEKEQEENVMEDEPKKSKMRKEYESYKPSMKDKHDDGIRLNSVEPFEDAMSPLNKGYYICGAIGLIIGLSGGIGLAVILGLLGSFLWWVVKANIALYKWKKLRNYRFYQERQISQDVIFPELIKALTPYGLRVDKRSDGTLEIPYKNVKLQIVCNSDGTFSMPWKQQLGNMFFDERYITSYKNTVAAMSILGYNFQRICSTETENRSSAFEDHGNEKEMEKAKVFSQEDFLQKNKWKNKKTILIGGIIVGLTALATICWIGNNLDIFNNSTVENEVFQRFEIYSPIAYSEVSYVDAFSLYFDNIKWETIKTDDGIDVVEFNGTCYINGQLANVCMQFSLDNEGSCEVSYIDIDGEPGNLSDVSKIITAVFENAYQEKGLSLYNSNYDYSDPSDSENVTMVDTYISDEALEELTAEAYTPDMIDEEGSFYLVIKDTFLWEDMNQKTTVCKLAQGEELMITDSCGDGWLYGIYGNFSGFIREEDIEILDDYTMNSAEAIETGVSENVEKALSGRYEVYFGGDGGAVLEITYLSDEDIYAVNFSGSMLDYAGEAMGFLVAYSDGSDGIWEFYEDSAYEAGNYTPSMSLKYDGTDSIEVTSLDGQTFGGMNFPGFEGSYTRIEEYPIS
ncbi:MAG: zinc ribbon domain-containing protein [Clostridiales bacterium]|nr:zinc ribbon domain-containing protein [Clostridiales bacterium]